MEAPYDIVSIIIVILVVAWRIFQLKKKTASKIHGEIILTQVKFPFPWLSILFASLFFILGYTFPLSRFMCSIAIGIIAVSLTDFFFLRKQKLNTHAVRNSSLFEIGHEQTPLNLEKLIRIAYNPIDDSFEIYFQDGESTTFSRKRYLKGDLFDFINESKNQSKFPVEISDTARSKLYSR